tara:strand:- start:570 stop:884 length:315 start_codon:yes stop_codon:yes gene_type:complete
MRTERYPIEIDGRKFWVDRTFGNDPAVFSSKEFKCLGHIDEDPNAEGHICPLKPHEGQILIVAHLEPPPPLTPTTSLPPKASQEPVEVEEGEYDKDFDRRNLRK